MNINIHGSDIQACRVCLATDVKLISLLDLNLKRMYSEFSGVPTMATDGLPQHICVYCCAMLKKSSKFRKKCEATYYLLLEHLLEKQDLTTTYFNTIDTSHLRIAMDTTAIVNYNYIPDKLLSIKEEICEMEERADEPCSTYDDEIYATGTHDVSFMDKECEPYNQSIKIEFDKKVNSTEKEQNDVEERMNYYKNMFLDKNLDSDKELFYTYVIDKYVVKSKTEKIGHVASENSLFSNGMKISDSTLIKSYNLEYSRKQVKKEIRICDKNKKFTRKRFYEYINNNYINNNTSKSKRKVKDISCMRRKDINSSWESFEKFCKEYNFEAILMLKNEKGNDVLERKESEKYKNSKYKCELCYTGFSVEKSFQNHKALHDPSRPYECEYCHLRFKDGRSRRKHVASHNHKLACRQCGQIVRWMSTARKHYKNHSGIGFKCVHCGMKFKNYDARMNHIRTLHREVSCDICEMKIRGEAELARHKMEAHSELFKCPSCLVQFHNANALRRHAEATHTGCGAHIRPCTECGESNADDLQLEVHMLMKHTPQKRSRAPLEEGSRRRGQPGGPQKLICEICAREFKFQSELRAHQESKHSSGRPYVCDYCTSTFKTKMVLRTHILRVHSRPRYACPKPHCARVFRQVQHLDSHLLAHSNEKNFVCDICQVRFKHPASLSVHRQTIHEGKPARKRNRK